MRRALIIATICILLSLVLALLSGCGDRRVKEVEYDHWTGASDESGTGDSGIKFDVGGVCGDGVVQPPEQCDLGDENGPDAACLAECVWNIS